MSKAKCTCENATSTARKITKEKTMSIKFYKLLVAVLIIYAVAQQYILSGMFAAHDKVLMAYDLLWKACT